ncbi:MAG: D-erythronate dehydrogenase [Ramlibacter sp.]
MNILITGGAGFLGARLARVLLERGHISIAGGSARKIENITLADRAEPPADLAADPRVRAVVGDLNAQIATKSIPAPGTDIVFHLAAAVSGECDADFDLGMRRNFDATRGLLDACRALGNKPMFVFASSLAVFGNLPGQPLPNLIEDFTLPTPQSSYGIQKFIGEQLVADYGRKGFVNARSARLMTVSVRPGRPNGAASSFFSGMIREPLAGVSAQVPVPPETQHAFLSPRLTTEALIRVAEVADAEWGPLTAINLPAMSATVGEMAAALERVAGPAATALLDWRPDPAILRLVKTWPGNVASARARALGMKSDETFEAIVRDYVSENPGAIKLPVR